MQTVAWTSVRRRHTTPPALWLLAAALAAGGAMPARGDALSHAIEAALSDKRLKGARVGVQVRALGSGRVLYGRNAADKFILASNQKLLVAATALEELGVDYEFRTALTAGDAQDAADGTLDGGLALRGGGDPTLGSPLAGEAPMEQFNVWADALAAKGIRRVKGDLIVDDSMLDRLHVHPDWPTSQLSRRYYAPVSATTLNDNCVAVTIAPGAEVGAPALVTMTPAVPFLKVVNTCRTRAKKARVKQNAIQLARAPDGLIIKVGGWTRLGSGAYTGKVAAPHPALFTGAALAQALKAKGIALDGTVRLAAPADLAGRAQRCILAERRTPIAKVLRIMLKHSHNLYAEHVIKTVGAGSGGRGSWKSGLARTAAMLRKLHYGPKDFDLADGSGLSRGNRASADLVCNVLVAMDKSPNGKVLPGMLSVAGVDGTLRRRMRTAPCKGRVWAKTGYLRGVGALSGYARAEGGARVAFSLLINDFKPSTHNWAMKEIEDKVVKAIVQHAQ